MQIINKNNFENGAISAPVVTGRLYKDRVFRMVFKQKPYALALYNADLLKQCKPLRDYMIFVDKTRFYQQSVSIEDAVEKAIEECIREDILRDFFRANKAEVIEMSIFEYDEELHMRQERSSSYAEGKAEGKAEDKITLVLRNRGSFAIDMLAKIFDMEVCEVERILNLADQNPEKDADELLELMR